MSRSNRPILSRKHNRMKIYYTSLGGDYVCSIQVHGIFISRRRRHRGSSSSKQNPLSHQRHEISQWKKKKEVNTHVEVTGIAILIRGRAFQVLGASGLRCLAGFSADSVVVARSRFTFLVLDNKVFLGVATGSW